MSKIIYVFLSLAVLLSCGHNGAEVSVLPEIVVAGKMADTVFLNEVYKSPDAGIYSIGMCIRDIIVTGTVNTAVPGTYYEDFDYTDKAGRQAATVTRTVVVVINKSDSLKIVGAAGMYKQINIAKDWETRSGRQQKIKIDADMMTCIYLGYTCGSYGSAYKINKVEYGAGNLVLTTTSHLGDTLCYWVFKQHSLTSGRWSVYKPSVNYRKDLGSFSPAQKFHF